MIRRIVPGIVIVGLASIASPQAERALATLPGYKIASRDTAYDETTAFDRADRRARAAIGQIRCAQRVSRLRRSGAFGPLDSLGGRAQCAVVSDRYIGVFFDSDTLFGSVSRMAAVDLETSALHSAALDTAGILAVARAARTAQLRGSDMFRSAERQYAPVAFHLGSDSIEVWLLPAAVLAGAPLTVGGERGYVFTGDGRQIAREVDHFDSMRTLTVPDTGIVRIPRREETVPTITELMVANILHDRGRRVWIDMQSETATLRGDGANAVWIRVAR